MEAEEFYRKRLIELTGGITQRIARVQSLDLESGICEDYHQHKLKLLDLRVVINWVATKEKLPTTEGNFYLVWHESCCISKAVWHGGSFTAVEQGWEDEIPTHWAELPKPPCL